METWKEFQDFLNSKSLEELQRLRNHPMYSGVQQQFQNAIYQKQLEASRGRSFGTQISEGFRRLTAPLESKKPPGELPRIGAIGADIYGRGPGEETSQGIPRPPSPPVPESAPTATPEAEAPAPRQASPAVALPPPLRVTPMDPEKILGAIPQVPPREEEKTFKADPYMTMLQTGLRILAAKPELGQSPISQIAGPLAAGVEQYRGEKREETKAAREERAAQREDLYRRAQIGQQAATLTANIVGKNQELAVSLARAGADQTSAAAQMLRAQSEANFNEFRQRAQDPQVINTMASQLARRNTAIEEMLRDPKLDPAKRRELQAEASLNRDNINTIRGTSRAEVAAGATTDRSTVTAAANLRAQAAKLQLVDPTAAKKLMDLAESLDPRTTAPDMSALPSRPSR